MRGRALDDDRDRAADADQRVRCRALRDDARCRAGGRRRLRPAQGQLSGIDLGLRLPEREVHELRRANEILKSASVFFAKELDPDRTR